MPEVDLVRKWREFNAANRLAPYDGHPRRCARRRGDPAQNAGESLDPISYPPGVQAFTAHVVIDACRPWERLAAFPDLFA
jgi:hypothetical protein